LLNAVVEAKVTSAAFVDVVGRSCLEAVLWLSAAEIDGKTFQPYVTPPGHIAETIRHYLGLPT